MKKSVSNDPRLFLALVYQTNIMDGYGGGDGQWENLDEYETDSISGSDDVDGVNSDDQVTKKPPAKKRKYHRHSPRKIQELEALFSECQHPSDRQRIELGKRLSMEPKQVKFWFQNRRTQMKNQMERSEVLKLREENDRLRAENINVRAAMRNVICMSCGGKPVLGELSLAEENARLKELLSAISGEHLGRPVSVFFDPSPSSKQGPDLAAGFGGNNQGVSGVNQNLLMGDTNHQFHEGGVSGGMPSRPVLPHQQLLSDDFISDQNFSTYSDLAVAATEQLVLMTQTNEPLWIPSGLEGGRETLNHDVYKSNCMPFFGENRDGIVTEASRETGVVLINTVELVETLMDAKRYVDMFPSLIARCNITNVISGGKGGTRNGALQQMYAEFRIISPLVPVRKVNFLRHCKQHDEGVWSVVDTFVDEDQGTSDSSPYSCRRLPSGCVVQPIAHGYSKVTWVEHTEYHENMIHHLYKQLVNSGLAFGAPKWIATLQRQCECNRPNRNQPGISQSGMKNMLTLAQRMTNNFCDGVCPSSVHGWNRFNSTGNVDADVRLMIRTSINDRGIPVGVVLNAATSVRLPISQEELFNYLRDEHRRTEWDVLSKDGQALQMFYIPKGQDPANGVSLLRAGAVNTNDSSLLIFQETCTDASGSLVVYAAVDLLAMNAVLKNGGDPAYLQLLPCGFAIVPDSDSHPSLSNRACADGPSSSNINYGNNGSCGSTMRQLTSDASLDGARSVLTVAFQILVHNSPTGELTVESVGAVSDLISNTLQNIKSAFHC